MLRNSWLTLCAFAIIGMLVRSTHAQAPKKEEKIRAYEFGFTIDEQQHRHEQRDERGIVMGEFGFITADGIYHVTVYATDEEGKFRILAMRNYPYESPPKTVDMIIKPKPKSTAATTRAPPTSISTTTLQAIIEKKVLPKFDFNIQGCAGCFIKNGSPKAGEEETSTKTAIRPLSQSLPKSPGQNKNTLANGPVGGNPSLPVQTPLQNVRAVQSQIPATTVAGASPQSNAQNPTVYSANPGVNAANAVTPSVSGGAQQQPVGGIGAASRPGSGNIGAIGGIGGVGGSGKSGPSGSFGGTGSPSASGEPGDLYRFKYILDYNGHTETGSRNGNKEGNYFAIGDDNVERTIEYVANELGYQPRIRWRKLDAPVQSKENTLKDYEFVWFKQE